ncbi:MAG: peptidase S14 [Ruminococcaceae bacterium]|nr:peptidase S14 [Oscillospiraceae bacterium]
MKNDMEPMEFEQELEQEKEEKLRLETISMSNAVTTHSGGRAIHTMTVIGQVEGHYLLGGGQKSTKYEQIIPLLVSVEESEEVDGLLLILNTVGGDVEAGLAIAELIASMSKPTVSLVLGGGHSIGVPLAVCADRSFIVPSATMTIHPVRTNGLVISSPQTFRGFEKMQDRIIDFIVAHSSAEASKLRELMMKPDEMATDIGTVLEGREAVSLGLIDEIGGLKEALACLHKLIDSRLRSEQRPSE